MNLVLTALADALEIDCVAVPDSGSDVCPVCRGHRDEAEPMCGSCRVCRDRLSSVCEVVPISLYCKPSPMRDRLRHYKESDDAGLRHQLSQEIAALVERFFGENRMRLEDHFGGWDSVCVVPSSDREPPHPLETALTEFGAHACGPLVRHLKRGSSEIGHRRPNAQLFEPASAVTGRRVLLLDDVFTTGARSQSAASTLRNAGALVPLVVAVARRVNPDWRPAVRQWWDRQSEQPFALDGQGLRRHVGICGQSQADCGVCVCVRAACLLRGSHMPVLRSHIDTSAKWFAKNCDDMRGQLAELDELQQQAAAGGGPRGDGTHAQPGQDAGPRAHLDAGRPRLAVLRDQLAGRLLLQLRRRRRAGDGHRCRERRRVHDRRQRSDSAGRCHHGVRRPQDHASHRDLPRQPDAVHPVRRIGRWRSARRRRPPTPDARTREPLRGIRPAVLRRHRAVEAEDSVDLGGVRQLDGRRRLPARDERLQHLHPQPVQGLSGRAAAGEDGDRRGLRRRDTGRGADARRDLGLGRLPRRGRGRCAAPLPGGRRSPQLAQAGSRPDHASRPAGPRSRRTARADAAGSPSHDRLPRGHRPHHGRLPLRGVQVALRHHPYLRLGLDPRFPGGNPGQQRTALQRQLREGHPVHPAVQPAGHPAAVPCRTSPATWWARTSSRAASSRTARR